MDVLKLRNVASDSPCKIIKFAATDGVNFSYNGEFYHDCSDCKRTQIEQAYPDCKANHAEWGVLAKSRNVKNLHIFCMTPDGNDYHFDRFWCKTCSILIPMFGVENVYMWNGRVWVWHKPNELIYE
jgi:hypothetical protein